MPSIWSLSDVSLVLLRKRDLFKMVMPSNIFDSMAMNVPRILGVEGASKDLIERADAGVCIAPEDAAQLAQAVVELAENADRRKLLGSNGYQYVAMFHDRSKLAEQYEKVLLSLVGAS